MDDVDDEKFSRRALLPAPGARHVHESVPVAEEAGPAHVEGEREEQLVGPSGRPSSLRVRGLGPGESHRIREELQLLAALEVAGLSAAPAVLEIEDGGYVRETAPPLRRQGGRRAAETVTPPTGERLALARAREALDSLVEALHARGWVLGAPPGDGLGTRADGSVVVLDLHGLRREDRLDPRQEDRRWVDSVLQDQDRTLRRRVHVDGLAAADGDLALGTTPVPEQHRDTAGAPSPVPAANAPESSVENQQPGLPAPRRLRRRNDEEARQARPPSGTARRIALTELSGRGAAMVRDVLVHPRLRRTALLSGLAVLLGAAAVVLGSWWAGAGDDIVGAEQTAPSSAPASASTAPAPEIQDPRMLAAELAGARHAYVTGTSEAPASAPATTALAEDQRVRAAYEAITVRGGGPVVHSAEVVDGTATEDTAVLRAVTSIEEHELEGADGEITTVPASAPVAVLLTLRWDGKAWLIEEAEERETAAQDGAE